MAGRAAMTSIDAVLSDIRSVRLHENPAGVGAPDGETSAIGGVGRKGADANGNLSEPMYTRIDEQLAGKNESAMATLKGEQHVGYGVGRTFGK